MPSTWVLRQSFTAEHLVVEVETLMPNTRWKVGLCSAGDSSQWMHMDQSVTAKLDSILVCYRTFLQADITVHFCNQIVTDFYILTCTWKLIIESVYLNITHWHVWQRFMLMSYTRTKYFDITTKYYWIARLVLVFHYNIHSSNFRLHTYISLDCKRHSGKSGIHSFFYELIFSTAKSNLIFISLK